MGEPDLLNRTGRRCAAWRHGLGLLRAIPAAPGREPCQPCFLEKRGKNSIKGLGGLFILGGEFVRPTAGTVRGPKRPEAPNHSNGAVRKRSVTPPGSGGSTEKAQL